MDTSSVRRRRPHSPDLPGPFISTQDGAADQYDSIELDDLTEPFVVPTTRKARSYYKTAIQPWNDEYTCVAVCLLSIIALALVLWHYDGKQNPKFAPGVQLDMIVIALVTTSRVAMESVVEACISQYAWIWISGSHQRRTNTRAVLKDFKLFDEAARGL